MAYIERTDPARVVSVRQKLGLDAATDLDGHLAPLDDPKQRELVAAGVFRERQGQKIAEPRAHTDSEPEQRSSDYTEAQMEAYVARRDKEEAAKRESEE
jgi:hypothetical protein